MILAGDIGGTSTRLALFRSQESGLRIFREETLLSRDYGSLLEAVETFLRGDEVPIRSACFGVAGLVTQGKCDATNLPWDVSAERLGDCLKIASVTLYNDVELTAFGALELADKECYILNSGESDPQGNRAIIAAGTGLGEALLIRENAAYRPLASEGGHCDFAPRNAMEIALLEYLLKRYGRVSYERILSGSGIFNIYQFLKETGCAKEPPWLSDRLEKGEEAAVISEEALAGKSELCMKTLDLFVSLYGAEAGNLALKTLATDGIYIGGGIAPKIIEKLLGGIFMKAFLDKGRFSSMMGRIPVRVILNDRTALLGAARVASRHQEV